MDIPELWTALLSGQYDLANQMICDGANVNETTKTVTDPKTTLLHYAVGYSYVRCIRVLANLGANFNATDSKKLTPLHWAGLLDVGPDVVEELINGGAVVDARDLRQMTPLQHYAIRKKCCIESVQKLIDRGASIDATCDMGGTVLHMAACFHNLEMVKLLISYGVNIDAKDDDGRTPLLLRYSVVSREREGKIEMIQLLLDNGADINAKTNEGIFSVLIAAKYNFVASLQLLLKRGARVNEATNTGETALHVACKKGLANVTALLLEFGADLNARNQEGLTPFDLLPNNPSGKATVRMIISQAVKREALGQSPYKGYKEMAQSRKKYSKFEKKCRKEIKRMYNEKIDAEDSVISFFHIFSIDEEKLTTLARNEKIAMAFESTGHVASFRIYAGELFMKFEVAKKRANFLTSVEDFLSDALGGILPAAVLQKIAVHVKYGDIIENEQ